MYGFTVVLRRKKQSTSFRKHDVKKQKPKQHRRREKRKPKKFPIKPSRFLPLGFLVFAVIISVIVSDNSENVAVTTEKERTETVDVLAANAPADDYSFYYEPIVVSGIEKYKSGKDFDLEQLVSSGCWSIIRDEEEWDKYAYSDYESIIPSSEVEKRSKELFGEDVAFENMSVTIDGKKFKYENGNYVIPLTAMTPDYIPKLLNVKKEKNKIILDVGCLKSDEYVQDKDGETVEPEPSYYLEIVLKEKNGKKYIYSVKKS